MVLVPCGMLLETAAVAREGHRPRLRQAMVATTVKHRL
jgi:hypothetical protein